MKCPYREFKDCIIEQCPSCNYDEIKKETIQGRYPPYMSSERAIKEGFALKYTKTTYEFISCKLINNNVQPMLTNKQEINNNTKTNVIVKKSIF